jgi:imidazolonepropionase-like amidohydrolase
VAQDKRFAIRAARVFDGRILYKDFPLVVIDGSRVAAVDSTTAGPPGDLPVLTLGDVTLLPGLIDTHVHLAFDPASTTNHQAIAAEDRPAILTRMRRHALQQLRAGITTVRDLGDRDYLALALRDEYLADPGAGPEIVAAGPPITRTRGHCWFLGGEADGIAGLQGAVAERVARGVDVIKIMATGGNITPGWGPHESQYTFDELAAATEAAHAQGRPITAHAHGAAGITDAVAAGVDGIEHGSFFTEDGVEPDWRTVDAMVRAGTFVGATEALLPEGEMIAPHVAARIERRCANFARMHREGVRLVSGSDAGVIPRKPHGVLPWGIIHLGSIGLTNLEAIASATTEAAEACGIGDRKGRIAPGYDADLVAVAGNPLLDLDALLDVRAVIRMGRPVVSARSGPVANP